MTAMKNWNGVLLKNCTKTITPISDPADPAFPSYWLQQDVGGIEKNQTMFNFAEAFD